MPKVKVRCLECHQKIQQHMLMMHTCRCKGIYCSMHMHAHGCKFDYNEDYKIKSRETIEVIDAAKIVKL
jgi:hypothetical protein